MMHITEDTPPDMLAGAMDLTVHLPNGRSVKMSVERSTPMMDVLVQITTAHHLQLSGYVIEALGMAPSSEHSDKILPYKPNTPIGTLDTQHIRVVPKARSLPAPKNVPPGHQPFESTFRLKVHLPRKQLFVSRVSMNVHLEDIMGKVCDEKNLDPVKYEFRHPENLDEVLDPKLTLSDYQITEVYVVSKGSSRLSQAFSASDIMALRKDEERKQSKSSGVFNLIFKRGKTSNGSGSLSSDNRSISPTHSDDSRSVTPPVNQQKIEKPKAPLRKRRPAPKPPQIKEENTNEKKKENSLTICHSRNSSDSSGYHEASILSDNVNTTLPRRPQTMIITEEMSAKLNGEHSKSTSNLTAMSNQSKSTSSLAFTGRKKKAPPPPPALKSASSATNLEKASPVVASPVEKQESREDKIISAKNIMYTTNSPPESIASSVATTLSSNIETDINLSKENSEIVENEKLPVLKEIKVESEAKPKEEELETDWQYQLPSPPTAFRDSSPTIIETNYESTEKYKPDSVVTSPELFEKLQLVKEAQSDITPSDVTPSEITSVISEEEKPIFNKLSLENLEKRKSLVYNRELATSLKYKDDESKAESVSSKRSSVLSELEEVINNPASRSSTLNKSAVKPDNFIHSAADSTLPNFKITTYDMPKKKINIFEDDSIRSNAENKSSPPAPTSNLLGTYGRSMENISYKKTNVDEGFKKPQELNKYRAKTLARTNTEVALGRSESFSSNNWVPANPVKRSKSQVAINQYKDERKLDGSDGDLSKSNSLFDVSGLQSLEVMRLIQTKLNTPCNSTEQLDKNEDIKEEADYDEVDEKKEPEKVAPKPVAYQYRGPPSINLGTWSERPKSQISLKEDTDYKFNSNSNSAKCNPGSCSIRVNGVEPNKTGNVSIKVNGSEPISTQASGNVIIKIGSNEKKDDLSRRFINHTAVGYRKPLGNVNKVEKPQRPHSIAYESNFDISRVPIVRSVELKKPYKDMQINNTSITQIYQKEEESKSLNYSTNLYNNNNNSESINRPVVRINSFSQNTPVVKGFDLKESKMIPTYKTLPSKPKATIDNFTTNQNVPFSQINLRRTDSTKNNQTNTNNNIFSNVVLRNTSNSYNNNRYASMNGKNVEKPPPPPVMPKTVQNVQRVQPTRIESPLEARDELLSAIRNFGGKKGLKSVKV